MADTGIRPSTGRLNLSDKNPLVTPLAGTLAAVGLLVSMVANSPTVLTPNRGDLSTNGSAPSIQRQGILTPGTGAIAVSGQTAAPSRSLTTGTGAITTDGVAASLVHGQTRAPNSGSLKFGVVSDIRPDTGGLTLAGAAPSLVHGFSLTRQPGVGSLTATGVAPTIPGSNLTVTPGAGSVWFGEEPINVSLTPGAGRLILGVFQNLTPNTTAVSLTGAAPSLLTDFIRAPTTGALVVTGGLPGSVSTSRTPLSGVLTATGQVAGRSRSLTPTTGILVASGAFPVVGGFVQAVPPSGALALQGAAPTLVISGVSLAPATTTLGITGAAPSLLTDRRVQPPTGALLADGQTSAISGQQITTSSGAAAFASDPPALQFVTFLRPAGGVLVAAGREPNINGAPPRGGRRYYPRPHSHTFVVPERDEETS